MMAFVHGKCGLVTSTNVSRWTTSIPPIQLVWRRNKRNALFKLLVLFFFLAVSKQQCDLFSLAHPSIPSWLARDFWMEPRKKGGTDRYSTFPQENPSPHSSPLPASNTWASDAVIFPERKKKQNNNNRKNIFFSGWTRGVFIAYGLILKEKKK